MSFLTRWAPVFRFDSQERYFPSSVDWYLQRATLVDSGGNQVLDPPGAVIDGKTRKDASALVDPHLNARRDCFLNLLDSDSRGGDLAGAKCYGFQRPVLDEQGNQTAVDLFYWVFYPYNGNTFRVKALVSWMATLEPILIYAGIYGLFTPLMPVAVLLLGGLAVGDVYALVKTWDGVDKHEGDWEHITVRVSSDGSAIQEVYFSQHDDGGWRTQLEKTPDGRPIAYVAKHSHATYPQAGRTQRHFGLALDECDGATSWDTREVVVDVGFDPEARKIYEKTYASAQKLGSSGNGYPIVTTNGRDVVEVHRGDGAYWYTVGRVDAETAAVKWFPSKGRRHGGGSGFPCAALTRDNFVISVHRDEHSLYYDIGGISEDDSVAWPVAASTFYDGGTGDPWVAANGEGYVVEVHTSVQGDGKNHAYYNVGVLDPLNRVINWAVKGRQYDLSLCNPSVAMNQRGLVVEAHWTLSNPTRLVYRVARFESLRDGGGWAFTAETAQFGGPARGEHSIPDFVSVSLNDDGVLMAVYHNGGRQYLTDIGHVDLDNRIIHWTVKEQPFEGGSGRASVAIADDKMVVAFRDKSSLYFNSARHKLSGYASWTPLNGQIWLKYSGRWGRKSDPTILMLGDYPLVETSSGPQGPAFKDSWSDGD